MRSAHWEDYWASGGTSDRALGDAAQRAFLASHWSALFARLGDADTIVDIGCGDGAIFAYAREQLAGSRATLLAFDASPSAARAAMRATRGVMGAAADATRLPLKSGAADVVVSQFGLEYGGESAFEEAARILKPGGRLVAICHLANSSIYAECAENARVLQAVMDQGLTDRLRAALSATYATCRDASLPGSLEAETALHAALRELRKMVRATRPSPANAVVESAVNELAAVSARRLAYDGPEALAFVEQVDASIMAYLSRMRSMLAAACSRRTIGRIARRLRLAGLDGSEAVRISWTHGGQPSAWRIEARRPSQKRRSWLRLARSLSPRARAAASCSAQASF